MSKPIITTKSSRVTPCYASNSTAIMPLELRIVTEELDLVEFSRIATSAFGAGGMTAYMVTPNPTPADAQKAADKHIKSWREESDVTYVKVIDTDLDDKMIAGAKWRINEKERTEEQVKSTLPIPGADEEGKPAKQDFMRYLAGVRQKYMGTKPFCCRLVLCNVRALLIFTSPSYLGHRS
jgi:hypothetical protein